MNHISPGLKASKAIEGFLQAKAAEALSPNTLVGYRSDLNKWLRYARDVEINQVKAQDIRAYLAYLRTDYTPHRITGSRYFAQFSLNAKCRVLYDLTLDRIDRRDR